MGSSQTLGVPQIGPGNSTDRNVQNYAENIAVPTLRAPGVDLATRNCPQPHLLPLVSVATASASTTHGLVHLAGGVSLTLLNPRGKEVEQTVP